MVKTTVRIYRVVKEVCNICLFFGAGIRGYGRVCIRLGGEIMDCRHDAKALLERRSRKPRKLNLESILKPNHAWKLLRGMTEEQIIQKVLESNLAGGYYQEGGPRMK